MSTSKKISPEIAKMVSDFATRMRMEKEAALRTGDEDLRIELAHYDTGVVQTKTYRLGLLAHRVGGPAVTGYTATGEVLTEQWYLANSLHRVDGPAHVIRNGDGRVVFTQWYLDGSQCPAPLIVALTIEQEWSLERADFELRRSAFGPLFEAGFDVPGVLTVLRQGIFIPEAIAAIADGAPLEWAIAYAAGSVVDPA